MLGRFRFSPIVKTASLGLATALFAIPLASCGGAKESARPMVSNLAPSGKTVGAAGSFVGADGTENGSVVFVEGPRGMIVRIDISGLSEGWHGVHLHAVGDCSDHDGGFKASTSHINPDDNEHGLLNPAGDKRADVTNIYIGPDGRGTAEFYRVGAGLNASEEAAAADVHPMLDDDGFAVIIHQNEDDHLSQPIGGTGGRVACAAIKG